jgi:hypothetical protein
MRKTILALIVSSFLLVGTAQGQIRQGTGLESNRYGMPLYVTIRVDDSAMAMGITQERLERETELLLRSIGMLVRIVPWTSSHEETLAINVHVVRKAFFITLEFWRNVFYSVRGKQYLILTPAYSRSIFGTHGKDEQFVIDGLVVEIEKFLDEYSKVNASP